MTTSISVIIPSYNRAHCLSAALDSVLQQSLHATEIILVDDGSDDQTKELMSSHYPQVKYLQQNNRGVSAARNLGIQHSHCEWIAFLDSDDRWQTNKLEKQVSSLTAQPEYKICHSDEIWIRNGVRVNPMNKHAKRGGYIFEHCLPRCAISPSSVVLHKSVFEEFGLFDESLPACEDYDLWLRLTARLSILYLSDKLVIKYGGHEDQLSRQHWGMDRFRVRALKKIYDSDHLDPQQKQLVSNCLASKLSVLNKGAKKHGNTELLQYCEIIMAQLVAEQPLADTTAPVL